MAVGDGGLLVPVEGPAQARVLAAAVAAERWRGVLDAVGGLRSVLVLLDPWVADQGELLEQLKRLDPAALPSAPLRVHRLPVVLDGPDLDDVCRHAGLSPTRLAEVLEATTLEVAMLGFSPGFAYLSGLPPALAALPRRATPRPSVPAGSLALAGGFAAIYPQSTPGGWQLVGRTPTRLFDPSVPPYALLHPGDVVRLDPSAPAHGDHPPLDTAARAPLRPPVGASHAFSVEDPGMFTTVQDAGRPTLAHLGVPAAGPADPLAHALANRLVGNAWDAPALEVTGRGPVLRCLTPVHVSIVGSVGVDIDGKDVGAGHVVPVAPGQRLRVGAVVDGVRCAVAVAGGFVVPSVLGSTSTDVLSGLGPGQLVADDVLGVGAAPGPMADRLASGAFDPSGGSGSHRVLRVLPGPHPDWFPPDALERTAGLRFEVHPASDRVGLRLVATGGSGVDRRAGELDSQGMVTGAVQVPPDGKPVVLGPDHATVGGYPVVAVVAACDRWLIGQCRPGDEVELAPVSPSEAAWALGQLGREAAGAAIGRYPSDPA